MKLMRGMFPDTVANHIASQLPSKYARYVNSGPVNIRSMVPICEDKGVVTILFCDICDFDELVARLPPMGLVQFLDKTFMMFDRICEEHNVMKIETVGKTYMAASMSDEAAVQSQKQIKRDARNTILAAANILRKVQRSALGNDEHRGYMSESDGKLTKISVQIGIHTGPVISGVVGSQKPQFALFGDTVNTASRMQSTGTRDLLHISQSTHQHVADDADMIWRQQMTQVKGKGMMRTYLLMTFKKDAKQKRVPTNMILDGNRTETLQSSPGSSRNGSPLPSQ